MNIDGLVGINTLIVTSTLSSIELRNKAAPKRINSPIAVSIERYAIEKEQA